MTNLNIVNTKENQFDNVSFVNTMTTYKLKVLVKRIWENFQQLANVVEDKGDRKDVAFVIDRILSGDKWSEKDIETGAHYFLHRGEIVKYDSQNKSIITYAVFDGKLIEVEKLTPMTEKEIVKV